MAHETGPEAAFVLALGRALHTYGTPAHQLEDTLNQVCVHLGLEAQFFTQPTSIFAAFGPLDRQHTYLLRVEPGEVQLDRLSQVQDVVAQVLSGATGVAEAAKRLEAVEQRASPYPPALVPVAFAVAGMTSSTFLGGGAREVAAAAIVGLAIGGLAIRARSSPRLRRVLEPVAALAASIIAGGLTLWLGPFSAFIATLGGVIVLMPGLTLTTAMTELSSRHLAAGTARLSGAVMVFLSMGFGVALGGAIHQHLFGKPLAGTPAPLAGWTEGPALMLAPLAYMVLLRAPRRDAPWVVLACVATFVGGRLGAAVLGPELGVFVGALTAGVVSNGYARLLRRPAHVTKVPSLLLLVPGSVGFRGLALLFQRDVVIGVEQAFLAVLMLSALVAGLLVANALLPESPSARGPKAIRSGLGV